MTDDKSPFSLHGKTAVVTGGTGVLCGEMAQVLAEAGAEVVVAGRSEEKAAARLAEIEAAGGSGYFGAVDVCSRHSIEDLLQQVLETSGRCDILINGAGTNSATPFFDITEDEFDQVMNTNARSVFLVCQVFGAYFVERGIPASIINIGSEAAITPISRVFTYSMSKAAVHNISKNLAREWAPHGIRVNTLVPGFFPAEQNRKILDDERVEDIMRGTPMQRFGEARELGGAVLLLASDAGSFITGAEIIVDGGFSASTI